MEAYAEDNVIKKRKMSFAMEDTPLTSLSFKLVPVHSLENEWSLFKAHFRTVQEKDPNKEATTKRKSAASRHVLFFDGSLFFLLQSSFETSSSSSSLKGAVSPYKFSRCYCKITVCWYGDSLVWRLRNYVKPQSNDRWILTQNTATLMGVTCCMGLATLMRGVGLYWL